MARKKAEVQSARVKSKAAPAERTLRVLVVEDHPDTRKGLAMFLDMLGYKVRFAEDMQSALEAAGGEEFDVLLSDIGLPDGNGWDLLRELEKRGRLPAAAIAMSGLSTAQDLEKSESAGFHAHLVKPFPPKELQTALAAAGKKTAASRRKHSADGR